MATVLLILAIVALVMACITQANETLVPHKVVTLILAIILALICIVPK